MRGILVAAMVDDDTSSDYLYQTIDEESASSLEQYLTPNSTPIRGRLNLKPSTLYRTCQRSSSPLNTSICDSIDLASDNNLDSGQSSAQVDVNGNPETPEDSSLATLVPNRSESSDSRLNSLLDGLIKVNDNLNHLQLFEQQIANLSHQVRMMKNNLAQQNIANIKLVKELLEGSSPRNAQETQTIRKIDSKLAQLVERKLNFDDQADTNSLTDLLENDSPVLCETLKAKLRRLPALVRGYLVRRLMSTERVANLKRTISDTSIILLNFKETNLTKDGRLVVTHEDILLHMRLCNQLEKACQEFYAIFINLPTNERMRIIAYDRMHKLELQERRLSSSASISSSIQSSSNARRAKTKI